MLLYKYCDPGGIAILKTGQIRLCRPKGFNDPFDANPYISKFDDIVQMNDYTEAKIKDIVMLSLAENHDSLLMWAHYATHKGFLIGLDGSSRMIEDGLVFRVPLGAVSYSHYRPSAERVKKLTAEQLYFRKSSEWVYEREWRVVTSNLAELAHPVGDGIKWAFPLIAKSVRTVIVGCRAVGLFPELYDILKEERYKHVSLKYAVPDIKEFKLRIKNWPRTKLNQVAPPELQSQVALDSEMAASGPAAAT